MLDAQEDACCRTKHSNPAYMEKKKTHSILFMVFCFCSLFVPAEIKFDPARCQQRAEVAKINFPP